jgi:hypothetical protein
MDGEEMFDYFKSSFGFDKNQVRTLTSIEDYLLSNSWFGSKKIVVKK